MLSLNLLPAFRDTDALGHINNAAMLTWFENARRPIFELFVPDLKPKNWNLILARVELDYLAQCNYQDMVEIKTSVLEIGNSSFKILQEAFQQQIKVASSKSVLVHFDYQTNKSKPIPEAIRSKLRAFQIN